MDAAALEADVLAAAGGDRQAFGRVVDATRGTVGSIALAVVCDVEGSEDVAQEVFLAAWRGLGKLRNPASFLPWIRQTTRFRARSWVRRRRRAGSTVAGEEALARVADRREDPHQALARREEERLIREALAVLSDQDREVLTLFYREGRSVRHVADLLDLSEPAVRQRLSRSRARLREEVRERLATALARTAPGAGFTRAVLLATAAAAPSATAAAAGLASATKAGGAGGAFVKLAAALGGAALGAAGGALGVVAGLRQDFRDARDPRELAALRRFRAVALAGTVAAAGALAVVTPLGDGWIAPAAVFVAFVAFLAVLSLGWLPRIVGPRLAAEAAADPAAARRIERRRRMALLGLLLGGLTGGLGLLAGLWLDGRLQ